MAWRPWPPVACDIHETARSVAEEDMMNFRRVERRMDAIRDVMVGLAVVLAGFAVFASDLDPGPLSAQVLGAVLVVLGGILTVGPLVTARRRRVRQD